MQDLVDFVGERWRFIYLIYVAFILALAVCWYFFSAYLSLKTLDEQTLHRQQVVARSGENSVENLVRSLSVSVILSANEIGGRSVINDPLNLTSLSELYTFLQPFPVSGVLLADAKGNVVYSSGRSGNLKPKNVSIADRDYFIWAEGTTKGSVFVASPKLSIINPTLDGFIAPVATPIFINGNFSGVLSLGISLDDFTKQYLDPLKLTDDTRIYLLDNSGVMVYSPIQSLLGKNYFDKLSSVNFSDKEESMTLLRGALASTSEGKIAMNLPNERTGKLTRYLISYSSIKFTSKKIWTLGVASPESVSEAFIGPIYGNQFALLIFFALTVTGFGILGVTTGRFHYYHKIKNTENARETTENN